MKVWDLLLKNQSRSLDTPYIDLASLSSIETFAKKGKKIIIQFNDIPKAINISWVDKIYQNSNKQLQPSDLVPIIESLHLLMGNNCFPQIRQIMESLQVEKIAPEVIVTILRATFTASSVIADSWFSLRDKTASLLNKRKMPSEQILRGLYI